MNSSMCPVEANCSSKWRSNSIEEFGRRA